ncbi:MAG: alkaline phosphatase [Candidatus Desulfovibrio kirbyi]|uniref:Alkaline phosphatase n=1 Tax=Candidatus Desulfovibrio kirbyi TaxID=2696086 RepID=A0A6L2R585_9BACT|nr:MAG: alkaline phosphatase [Candidatus Desulfovibrio kirbyi]
MPKTIKQFIQDNVLRVRLKKSNALVVYDPDCRYRELCLELADERLVVVDATESSIESREQAMLALQSIAKTDQPCDSLLVYVPVKRPVTDEERQQDPFAVYGVLGAEFPNSDGDEYLSLCLKAKPDFATEIRRVFTENPNPSFAVIDAVGGGKNWPTLRAALGVESARDILIALLAPNKQKEALKGQTGWVSEAKTLFINTLGLRLKTQSINYSAIADELWRFVLFSEFVLDLPGTLPLSLADVPHAAQEAKPLIDDLCDFLRDSQLNRSLYIERAEAIEKELDIPAVCKDVDDFGQRDTFPIEERTFFIQAADALRRDDIDKVRRIIKQHMGSVWVSRGESQVQWQLLRAAVQLVEACDDAERQLPEHTKSQNALIDFYATHLRETDRLQREFEQAERSLLDKQDGLDDVIAHARSVYRKLTDKSQNVFIHHLENSGWPPAGRLSNSDVFDKLVSPNLQESGRRVALLLVDALRYELGMELQKLLASEGQVDIQPAFAQLPSTTPVGMASLLPGAGNAMQIVNREGKAAVVFDGQHLAQVTQRMDVLKKRFGDRFTEMQLDEFVRGKKVIAEGVELFVLRNNSIDHQMEFSADMGLRLVSDVLNLIRAAIHKLGQLGFKDAYIVADHGFYLNTTTDAGDVCAAPPGNWINVHERCLLGDGTADSANYVISAPQLGIRGDFNQLAGPRAMVSYRSGEVYFHGGASLQETVVPVIVVHLQGVTAQVTRPVKLNLSYKRGASKVTTRLPVIEVKAPPADLLSMDSTFAILIEAHDAQNNVIGEAKTGPKVNPTTHTLSIKPGDTIPVTLRLDLEFEGKFTVKASDPVTMTTYGILKLETNYVV